MPLAPGAATNGEGEDYFRFRSGRRSGKLRLAANRTRGLR